MAPTRAPGDPPARQTRRLGRRGAASPAPHALGRSARLAVKAGRRIVVLRPEDIDWIEASNKHVRLHVGAEVHVARAKLKDLEQWLDPMTFVRIHRSLIVNVERIAAMEPWFHGEYTVVLADGTRLRSGRIFSHRLKALIG